MKRFGEKIEGIEYQKRPGSYGVIVKNGRIGVVKSSRYDGYFLVGGGIDEGEEETGALHREAREEIGFQIEIGEKIGEAIEYLYSRSEQRYVAKECHFYRILLAGRAEEKGKHKLAWITKDEINRMHHQCYRWIIEEELKLKDEPVN